MNNPHANRPAEQTIELQPYSDPYLVLGLPRTASAEQIKDAYFQLVRQHPPERDPETFKQIRAAYDRLRTPERRLETDMLLLQELPLSIDVPLPRFDLAVQLEDLYTLAHAMSDLGRTDFRTVFKKLQGP